MEIPEEAMAAIANDSGSCSSSAHTEPSHHHGKGRRTKRHRLLLRAPSSRAVIAAAAAASISSSGELSGSATEEDEDMANCLILLAQGRSSSSLPTLQDDGGGDWRGERFVSRRIAEAADAATTTKVGFYVYECKTCNKRFPSFQALGGHRSSHKKPKTAAPVRDDDAAGEGQKRSTDEHGAPQFIAASPLNAADKATAPVPEYNSAAVVTGGINQNRSANTNKLYSRVHECSICGSEFSSGQALGGHMRRHRPPPPPPAVPAEPAPVPEVKKEKCVLSLDLNLPAPAEDERVDYPKSSPPTFPFGSTPPLLFSSSALVDCNH